MLTLVLPDKPLTSASIPVRWCIDEAAFNQSHASGLRPFVMLEVNYESGHAPAYHLFPLDQYSAYIDIHHPGAISIAGYLMTVRGNKTDAIRKCFMTYDYDRERAYAHTSYETQLSFGSKWVDYPIQVFDASDEYWLNVSEDLFGKELPEWIKFFINRYWYGWVKPKDQCDQRRRIMLFPFTTLPIILIEFILRMIWNTFCTLICWLIGLHVGFKHIFHPFDHILTSTTMSKGTWLLNAVDNSAWMKKHKSMLAFVATIEFIPIVYLFFYWLAIQAHYTYIEALYASLALFWIMVIALALLVGIVVLLKIAGAAFDDVLKGKLTGWLDNVYFKVVNKIDVVLNWLESFLADDTERKRTLLLCHEKDGKCLPELTTRDKSFSLLFADIKNKVCKPMRG